MGKNVGIVILNKVKNLLISCCYYGEILQLTAGSQAQNDIATRHVYGRLNDSFSTFCNVRTKYYILSVLVFCVLLVSSCGYRIVGSGFLPFDSVTVKPVQNMTYEPRLEESLHNALSNEFLNQGIDVVTAGGDAELQVSVTAFSLRAIGIIDERVREQSLNMRVNAKMKDGEKTIDLRNVGSPINITFETSGTVGESILNKERAIEKASREISKEIVNRIILRYAE